MPAQRNRRHILVLRAPSAEEYTPHPRRVNLPPIPPPADRPAHGRALASALKLAAIDAKDRRREAGIRVHGAKPGLYVEFESRPGIELNLSSLENKSRKKSRRIELVAVTETQTTEEKPRTIQRATVFVPDGQRKHFITRFEKYSLTTPKKKRERRYEDMLDRLATLRLATLRALWTDAAGVYPAEDETIWWEVWLRRHDDREIERLLEFTHLSGLEVRDRRLEFDDRIVTLVRATPKQLSLSVDVLNDLAEVRKAKETAAVFVDMSAAEQADWVEELLARTSVPPGGQPAVCLFDTGVTRGHPLLEDALDVEDMHTLNPDWGTGDHEGHGTEMAGLALYGDLALPLATSSPVRLRHRLESVKILPPRGNNPPDLYGALTAEAASRVEIQAPARRRCFSMAISATDERDRGQPTAWSAAIDALAAGRAFDANQQRLVYMNGESEQMRRLFVLCAGNVFTPEPAHLDRSDSEPVHDPAQAWNALTVGAFTEKAVTNDSSWHGWSPVTPAGDLSPWSTTSVSFADPWPIKPDVVFEGGNVVHDGQGEIDFPVPDLSLLSTYFRPIEKSFVLTWATSAAASQVARMAAIVSAEYPVLWPETIRALIVHSADWTRAMKARLQAAGGKTARAKLVRRYGFGVPNLERALRSADDALTLVAQGEIHPFVEGKLREMHLHELPWPKEALESLGENSVRLRVTLSYFVEPNPGRRGWQRRHRYASHGLRFEVRRPTESVEDFRKRINQRALDEDEAKPSSAGDRGWTLGERARSKGSLHSDIWEGTAAELAERGAIGVFPVTGWWKEQPKRDRSDKAVQYALIVSIETQAADVDIWTPVAVEVGVPTEVAAIEV